RRPPAAPPRGGRGGPAPPAGPPTRRAPPRRGHLRFAAPRARPAGPADPAAQRLAGYQLTPREHQVLRLLVDGLTNRKIASRLAIPSEKTVSVHVSNVLRKLGVDNRGQAAALGHQLGIRPSPPAAPPDGGGLRR